MEVVVENRETKEKVTKIADKVFIGAGGHSIPLLQKSGVKQREHLGGFPISGQFLRCTNPDIIKQHAAKVYSKEPQGKPPMTVPHLIHVISMVNKHYYLVHMRISALNS